MAGKRRTYSFRKFMGDVHLWLGIASGIIVFILCASGTVLAFQEELARLGEPTFRSPEPGRERLPLAQLAATLAESQQATVRDIISYGADRPLTVRIMPNDAPPKSRGVYHWVDPYTAGVLESPRPWVDHWIHELEELHRWLLLDSRVGRPITGLATIFFVLICASGLVLWMPRRWRPLKAWRPGLVIQTKKSWRRFLYDVHNTLGFYALPLLLVMGLSGLIWSYEWYWQGLEWVLNDKLGKSRFDAPIPLQGASPASTVPIPLEQLLARADEVLTYPAMAYRVTLPTEAGHSVLVRKKPAGFVRVDGADKIQFDPYSGEVMRVERFGDDGVRSQIANLIRSIHVGSVFGTSSKLAYFVACLVATTLPLTGTWIWASRLIRKRKRRERGAVSGNAASEGAA